MLHETYCKNRNESILNRDFGKNIDLGDILSEVEDHYLKRALGNQALARNERPAWI